MPVIEYTVSEVYFRRLDILQLNFKTILKAVFRKILKVADNAHFINKN